MNFRITDEGENLRESTGDAAELARAVRISLCGIDLGRSASFAPASPATADYDWHAWLRGTFAEVLGAAFVEVFRAAGQMQVREALAIDGTLDLAAGDTSREAGGALFDRLQPAKKLRVVERARAILGEGNSPHFVTAFAIECAEFHLPLRVALVSYLYGEWRCGMAGLGVGRDLDTFAAAGGRVILDVVSQTLAGEASPFDHAAGL
jgi:hypothetical protein